MTTRTRGNSENELILVAFLGIIILAGVSAALWGGDLAKIVDFAFMLGSTAVIAAGAISVLLVVLAFYG